MNFSFHKARLILAVTAVIAAPAGMACAGEGNGDPFGISVNLDTVQISPVRSADGTYSVLAANRQPPTGALPIPSAVANSGQGEPEPLNALASAPEIGGVWAAHHVSSHG